MKIFLKYLIINLILIVWHVLMFFVGVMGFGYRVGNESIGELVFQLFLFGISGASPNFLIFLFSVFKKKNVRENAIWTGVFSLIIIVSYFILFSSALEL